MIPLRSDRSHKSAPIVTWTLVLLNVIIYVWDRQGSLFGPNVVFADLAMRPREVLLTLEDASDTNFPLVTLFTSMFLHGSLAHLLGNMIFLYVFGSGVEDGIGPVRYTLYYLAWGIAASMAHILVLPDSRIPTLGASGAIGGVLGAYFLLYPTSKIEVWVPILAFLSVEVSAWMLLGIWFAWQIFVPQEGVANWAHAGGFLAGMLTVLIMGGRRAILREPPTEYELA